MEAITFYGNIAEEAPIPEKGMISRTVCNDDLARVVAFGFAPGHELAAHTAPVPAILYFVAGEAELTLGTGLEKRRVKAGAFIHMPAQTRHGILALTPLTMLLIMLKKTTAAGGDQRANEKQT